MRSSVYLQARNFRKRARYPSTHIPQVRNVESNDSFGAKELRLHADSAEKVVEDLKKLGFRDVNQLNSAEETLLEYLDHTKTDFKKSSKNLNRFKTALSNEKKESNNRMKVLFDYILTESESEIKRLDSLGVEGLEKIQQQAKQKKLSNNGGFQAMTSEKELEKALVGDLISASEDGKESPLKNTEFLFQILADLNMRKLADADLVTIEQMVQAFEISKLIPVPEFRLRGVLLSGHLIYSLGRVRMDPVNESFYIDALTYYGLYKRAFELFNSNKDKINQRWWYEMGLMVTIRANYLRQFDVLLRMMSEKFQQPYVRIQVLKAAIKKKLFVRDICGAEKLTEKFLDIVRTYGWKPSDPQRNQNRINALTTFQEQSEAESFLDEIEIPTEHDFATIIYYHLHSKNEATALKLMAKYVELPGIDTNSYQYLFLRLKVYLLRDFGKLRKDIKPHLNPKAAEQKLNDLETCFNDIIGEMNITQVKKSFDQIFFDSLISLAVNPALTQAVQDFVVQKWVIPPANGTKVERTIDESKKFRGILKVLLSGGKEKEALELLSKMEKLNTDTQNSPESRGQGFFCGANAYHYAAVIDYYNIKSLNGKKSKTVRYSSKVEEIVNRINTLNIPYNGVFLTSLLKYYTALGDLNNCFNIINPLLNLKAINAELAEVDNNNLLSFYDRRDITRPLYVEIWKAYKEYYKLFVNLDNVVNKKSNYVAWKHKVKSTKAKTITHPQFSVRTLFNVMIHQDNILPDAYFYYIIIYTLIKSKDWACLPAVLKYMTEVHGLPLTARLSKYIMGGLESEYIVLENFRLRYEQKDTIKAANHPIATLNNAKRNVETMRQEGSILGRTEDSSEKTVNGVIYDVLQFLNYKNKGDLSEVKRACKELQIDTYNLDEIVDEVSERIKTMQ